MPNSIAGHLADGNLATEIGHESPSMVLAVGVTIPSSLQNLQQSNNEVSGVTSSDPFTHQQQSHPLRSFAGNHARSFKHDYYYRVHITPNPANLGNILATTIVQVEVWNAYFSNNTLASITETATDGISLTPQNAPPYVFRPLEHNIYSLSVLTDGPATVDGTYTLNFSKGVETLSVVGSRVTTFPIPPQWDKRIVETLSWKTDVIVSYDGSEQRVSLRREPRREMRFDITTNNQETQKLDSLLMNWLARPFAIPVWQDETRLTSQALAGTYTVYLDTIGRDYVVGNSVIFFTSFDDVETAEIVAITDTSLDIKLPIISTQVEGTLVYPIRIGRLPDKMSTAFITPKVDTAKMSFNIIKNDNDPLTEVPNTYRSVPILEDRPNYTEELKTGYNVNIEMLDNLLAEPYVDLENGFNKVTTSFTWIKKNKADLQTLREMLHARRGRRTPIWVPTWNHDLTMVGSALLGSNILTVKAHDRSLHVDGMYNRRDLMIIKKDGSKHYCRINSSVQVGSTEELAVSPSLPFAVNADDVEVMCYIEICRLSSDTVEIEWITPLISKITLGFTTLFYDV